MPGWAVNSVPLSTEKIRRITSMQHRDSGPARRRRKPRKIVAAVLVFGLSPLAFPASFAAPASADTGTPAPTALRVKYTTQFDLVYRDKGSAAKEQLAVYRAKHDEGWFQLGDVAVSQYDKAPPYALMVQAPEHDDASYPALARPSSFTRMWKSTGAGGRLGSLWHAVAPTTNGHKYTCLGDIAENGSDQPNPTGSALADMRCVRSDWVSEVTSKALWNDEGSGAHENGSVFAVVPKNFTGMDASTFETRSGYQPGADENYQALDRRRVAFAERYPIGVKDGPLRDSWTPKDWNSDQVMYRGSLGKGLYTGIPGWVIRTYCRKVGFGNGAGKCTLAGLDEEKRNADSLKVGGKINNTQILNCGDSTIHHDIETSSTTEDSSSYSQSEGVSATLDFSIEPAGLGVDLSTTVEESQEWSWASGSSSTKADSHRYTAEPGTAAWIAKVSHYGQMQGIAFVKVNQGIDWNKFTEAQHALQHHTIKNLIAATKAETEAQNGYYPVSGPGGPSDPIPVAVNMTGDLPQAGATNTSRGPGTAVITRDLSDDELKACVADNNWRHVKELRDSKHPNLAGHNATATTTYGDHDPTDAVDGNTSTYWESQDTSLSTISGGGSTLRAAQSLTLDLGVSTKASRLVLKLPPTFSDRDETVEVLGSNRNDDTGYQSLVTEKVVFQQSAGNTATLFLDPDNATWRHLRLTVTGNSGTTADDKYRAQLAELEVYSS
jgi:F5/8 type C domain